MTPFSLFKEDAFYLLFDKSNVNCHEYTKTNGFYTQTAWNSRSKTIINKIKNYISSSVHSLSTACISEVLPSRRLCGE